MVRAFVESLRGETLPLRLSYVGPVFRWLGGMATPRQYHEMGIELIGLGGLAGEAELLALASRSMEALGLNEFQPRIGQVGIMQHYLDSLGLDRRLSAFLLAHREILRDERQRGDAGAVARTTAGISRCGGRDERFGRAPAFARFARLAGG